jgi:hypothetical protein
VPDPAAATEGDTVAPAAPPARGLERVRTTNEYLEAGVKIGLILAGIFAGLQYCSSVATRRVERVLDYAREFDSGELLQTQRRIDRALAGMGRRIEGGQGNPAEIVAREEAAMMRALRQDGGANDLGGDLALVLGFMDKLAACQRRGLCDADLTSDYFRPYAAGLAAAFQCHLRDERRRRAGYGDGLLAIGHVQTLDNDSARRCPGGGG